MASQRPPQRRRGDQDSSGGEGAASNDGVLLPGDALYEILLRVPARPLCRFRAACRSWRSLLADPHFAAAHAAHHRRHDDPLFAVCVAGGSHGEAADVLLLDTSGRVARRVNTGPSFLLHQMQPHLDLVLLRRLAGLDPGGHPLRVLDPATGVVFPLPSDHKAISPSFVLGRALHGEYKVLSVGVRTPYATPPPCKVLTVDVNNGGGGHGVWRAVAPPRPPVRISSTLHCRSRTVVAEGVVYHLAGNSNSRDAGWRIAAFDLEAEQWRPALLQGPEAEASAGDHTHAWRSLVEVSGRLGAVCTTASAMDIWSLLAAGSSGGDGEQQAAARWCKRCRVLTSSVQRRRHWLFADGEHPLLCVMEDGRVALLVHTGENRTVVLCVYDPRTETCTDVATVENYLNVGIGVYTGNLLRLV